MMNACLLSRVVRDGKIGRAWNLYGNEMSPGREGFVRVGWLVGPLFRDRPGNYTCTTAIVAAGTSWLGKIKATFPFSPPLIGTPQKIQVTNPQASNAWSNSYSSKLRPVPWAEAKMFKAAWECGVREVRES
jgi:hypothetical protein